MLMEFSKKLALISTLAALLCFIPGPTSAEEYDDFSYNLDAWNGPQHWGDIHKEWETCKTGHMQSPVAIDDKYAEYVHQPVDLQWTYSPKNAVMKNLGHNIVIEWDDEVGAVSINGTEFPLKQIHWHTPSENTINGHRFPLEVHLLHQRPNDQKMAMVSILYTFGKPEPFFTQIENNIHAVSGKLDATTNMGTVDPKEVTRDFDIYYRLMGSITIPPCTEGVTWSINRKIRTISLEQLNLLKYAAIPEYRTNARPLQQLNDRVIKFFG